ncbi:HET-domain-containing protein, partial [Dothidotthia symphoricarpi CBS 119687]
METFQYTPLDYGDCSFRLIQLFHGKDESIQCTLFDAWLYHTDSTMEYEALSYTWGNPDKAFEIVMNGTRMPVTKNLFLALRYLRHPSQDRILWIDAICINQEDNKERGHQVQQMASIYKRAERVVIWLGQATSETDLIFRCMHQLEEDVSRCTHKDWEVFDERWRWQTLWSTTQQWRLHEGLKTLLDHPWFKRVWIIQEVALARSAIIVCGAESVSTGIFAVVPSLMGMTPDPHCQAILAIMPGPTRERSWSFQDLRTLLLAFKESKSTEPRDAIYALLGLSDAHDSDFLVPNYDKSMVEVIQDTVAFI